MIIGIVSIILPVLALILQCVFAGFSILCIPSIVTAVFAALAFWKKGPVLALVTVFMAFIQICTLNIQLTAILGLISAVASVFLMIDCEKFREAHPELEDPKAATKQMIIGFMLPCIITLLVMYAYPVVRTFLMSFFDMPNITASVSTWDFVGLGKYQKIYPCPVYAYRSSIMGLETRRLDEEQDLDIEGMRVGVMRVVGHSDDSLVYVIGNAIFTGDTLAAGRVSSTTSMSRKATLIAGIRSRLMCLDDNMLVFPGHGCPTKIRIEKMFNHDLLENEVVLS